VTLSVKETGTKVMLAVHDNGIGIPPGNLAKVFEPHFTTKAGGTGLGWQSSGRPSGITGAPSR